MRILKSSKLAWLAASFVLVQILLCSAVIHAEQGPLESFQNNNIVLRRLFSSSGFLEKSLTAAESVSGLSDDCGRDLKLFTGQIRGFLGIENGTAQVENWALQMFDSWAKIPEGILSGHVNALGDYDECVEVRGRRPDKSTIQGKYCLIYAVPNVKNEPGEKVQPHVRSSENLMQILSILSRAEIPVFPSIGSCHPATCSDTEIFKIASAILPSLNLIPVANFCTTNEPQPYSTGAIATFTLLGILVSLVVVGTLLDLYTTQYAWLSPSLRAYTLSQICLAFSLVSNGNRLLSTETTPNDVNCLYGLRFLGASWVVLNHTYLMAVVQPLWNIVDTYTEFTRSIPIILILNAAIFVDVFFVIGGFLVALTILTMLERSRGRLNLPMLYLRRYLRITPMYMVIVLVGTFVFPLLGSGPYWHISKTWASFCEKNWWKNLLYINNLPLYDNLNDPSDGPCHGMAWYLAIDMQLFLLTPFLLFPVWKWKTYGSIPLALFTISSVIIPGVITYMGHYLPMFAHFQSQELRFSQEAYTPTYMRATPYLVGIVTGILYHRLRNKTWKLNWMLTTGAWLLAFSTCVTVLISPYKYFNPEDTFDNLESAIHASGQRAAWSIAFSWVIFACATGNGGWINDFLSWKPFIPLGRITFAIYLVSIHLQFLFHLQYRQATHYNNYQLINLFFAHIVMSCFVAVVCTLMIEAPCMRLVQIILPTSRRRVIKKESNNNVSSGKKAELCKRQSVSPDPSAGSIGAVSASSTNIIVPFSQKKIVFHV